MTMLAIHDPVTPTASDSMLAKNCSRALARFSTEDLRVRVNESEEPITIPASAVRLIVDLLSNMAEGNAVTMIPVHAELTTQQAADILGVSRPFLIKQLEDKALPFRRVGSHRRILFSDLMEYKRSMLESRANAIEELTALSQELDMGY